MKKTDEHIKKWLGRLYVDRKNSAGLWRAFGNVAETFSSGLQCDERPVETIAQRDGERETIFFSLQIPKFRWDFNVRFTEHWIWRVQRFWFQENNGKFSAELAVLLNQTASARKWIGCFKGGKKRSSQPPLVTPQQWPCPVPWGKDYRQAAPEPRRITHGSGKGTTGGGLTAPNALTGKHIESSRLPSPPPKRTLWRGKTTGTKGGGQQRGRETDRKRGKWQSPK